jgi:hypothetical protein
MNRRRTTVLAVALATTATVLAGILNHEEASASHRARPLTSTEKPSTTGDYETTAYGLVVNIKNDSSYSMTFLKNAGRDPKNTPKDVLRPGDTDRLAYKADSTGMSVRLSYRVGDTQDTVFPGFAVPAIGPNNSACTGNDRSATSPVGSKCDIGSGWEPDAHLTFVNR